ncbi:MAG: VWA domain-containing protein [Mariniblastus sp.]|nr:VWA domain-containing protein [Mariniblastus sp.]
MNISPEPDIQKTSWRSFGLSLLFHTLLFLFLLVLIDRLPGDHAGDDLRRGRLVLAIANVDQTTDYLTEEEISDGDKSEQPDAAASSASEAAAPTIEMPEIPNLPGAAVVETLDVTDMANVPKNSVPPGEFTLSKEDLEMIAKEQRELKAQQPKGPPATIQVFGSGELKGQRFVFVIDRSKSMGSQGLGVLKRAVKELSSAINQLEDYHQFQIVAYHDRTITMSRRAMLPASEFNKQQAPEFIDGLIAFGGTSHDYGLYSALAFHPDIVVLMTDAGPPELNGGHLSEIKTMCRGHVQIHTIQFGRGPLQVTDNFMKQLSLQSRGSFRYIDVNQWYSQNK